ncbi:MAG TPA: hypothetical protein VL595_29550, partial [Pseudonocardia sp.]|nr:hypothetical protein [Pseudonocardia sp.]
DESSQANPTNAALTINNGSGDFSPRNPTGQYYGQLTRNTPMRLSVPNDSVYLRIEDTRNAHFSCANTAALNITGDIDIRVDYEPSDYQRSALAGKTDFSGVQPPSWLLERREDGTLELFWWDSSAVSHFAITPQPMPYGRLAARVTLAVATGTVTFYTAPTIAGPWTQFGSAQVLGATNIGPSTAPLNVGDNAQAPYGRVYAAQVLSGIGGTMVASPDFTAQVPGAKAFTDAQSNVWKASGTAELSDRRYRAYAEVPAWPPQWDPTGQDVYTQIQGAGLLRRLRAGTPPVQSALYRAYTRLSGSTAPVAYWPCEDGNASTQIASALAGGTPMSIFGSPQFASNVTFVCSSPIPVLNGSEWAGVPASGGTWSANVVRFLLQIPAAGDTNNAVVASVSTTGTVAHMDLVYTAASGGGLTLNCYNSANTLIGTVGPVLFLNAAGNIVGCNGLAMRVDVDLQPSGSNIQAQIQSYTLFSLGAVVDTVTITSASLGTVTRVGINPSGSLTQTAIGHVSVQSAFDSIFDLLSPLQAWIGETAGHRFLRLCNEQGVTCRMWGFDTDTVAMGYQLPGDFVSLLQECEDSDRGMMFEPKQALGLGYRTRPSMFNQSAALALTYTAAQLSAPIQPTDDDQLIANDLTVTRAGGSSYRATQTDGPLSVGEPPDGVGDYGQAKQVSLASDAQLPDEAGWLLHMGTVDDLRYPSLSANLGRPELAAVYDAAQEVKVGDRVTVASTPGFLPPDGVSQIVRGGTEVLYGFTFTETWNCAPEQPYRVAVFDDPVFGRGDTDGSTLVGNYSATATTLLVATTGAATGSPLWTTSSAEFPFDISAGGERMTVTNITGTSSPQTFTVTRSVNGVVKPQTAGTDVRLFQPAILSM